MRHVTTIPRDYKNPPHHLRCDAIRGDERCILGAGHSPSDTHKWRREVVA